MRRGFPIRNDGWRRNQTRHNAVNHRRRAEALAGLLAKVLREWQFTLDEHGRCESCTIDLDIYARQAEALGVSMSERLRDG